MVRKNLGLDSEKTRQTTILDFLFLNNTVCRSDSPKPQFRQTTLFEFSNSVQTSNHFPKPLYNTNITSVSVNLGIVGVSLMSGMNGGLNCQMNGMGFLGINQIYNNWNGENTVSILDEYMLLALNRSLLRACRSVMRVEENCKSKKEFNEKSNFIANLFMICLFLCLVESRKKKGKLKEKNLAKTFLIIFYVRTQIKVLGCKKKKKGNYRYFNIQLLILVLDFSTYLNLAGSLPEIFRKYQIARPNTMTRSTTRRATHRISQMIAKVNVDMGTSNNPLQNAIIQKSIMIPFPDIPALVDPLTSRKYPNA